VTLREQNSPWSRSLRNGPPNEPPKKMTKKAQTQTERAGAGRRRGSLAGVDRELQVRIGAQLRAMHDDIIHEGVPERFQELLAQLDRTKAKD